MTHRTLGRFVVMTLLVGCGSSSEVPSAPSPQPGSETSTETSETAAPDPDATFALSAPTMLVVGPGKTATLPIGINRSGRVGPVHLRLEGLPPGVTASEVDAAEGVNSIVLSVTADAAAAIHDGAITLRAMAGAREQTASPVLVVTGVPGARDEVFGEGGAYVIDNGWGTALTTLDDGRVLLVGSKGGGGAFVRRFLRSGALDETFGDHGVRELPHAAGESDEFRTVTVTPQGKLILTGTRELTAANKSLGLAARLSFDGSLDESFGTGGVVTVTHDGLIAELRGAIVQADGSAMLVGHVSNGACKVLVTRVHDNGQPDDTYGIGGSAIFGTAEGVPDKNLCVGTALALPNGDFVIGATAYSAVKMAVGKFTAAGTIDNSFGEAGFTLVDSEIGGAWFDTLAPSPDGSLVVGGETCCGNDRWPTFARVDKAGKLDTAFGTGGKKTVNLAPLGEGVPYTSNATASGELIFGGYAKASGVTQLLVGKLTANGQVDNGFGASGLALPGNLGRTNALTVGIDGRVIVASYNVDTKKSELVSFWH